MSVIEKISKSAVRKVAKSTTAATPVKVENQKLDTLSTEVAVKAAKRMIAVMDARERLIPFIQLMMPDPNDPDNPELSRYIVKHFHTLLAEALEKVERGEILRLIIIAPPRHGKSQLASRALGAWYIGRNPYNSIILTSYNEDLATDVGNDVRAMMATPMYAQVFPNCHLRKGSKAVDRQMTEEGGLMVFTGAGGTITGRGGDLVMIDDPVKNSEMADSPTFREKQWRWFTQDVMSRMMSDMGAIVIVSTRWHEDDIIGRLTDPKNPCYNADEAKNWKILHLTALAEKDDPFGRKVDEALWEERHSAKRLMSMRRLNPRGFNANYQGRPTPEDGVFFQRSWLKGYRLEDLPKNLTMYCASDHAVGQKQENDKTCLMAAGVDENDHIWIMPDLFWERAGTEVIVEKMIDMMELHEPLLWWGENDHILKSIGPFLRKRMLERKVFCTLEGVTPRGDKRARAQAIRGRMSMGMVHFPVFAPWWADAMDELLKFDRGRHDDFVDPLAHIGRGLGRLVKGARTIKPPKQEPRPGSPAWMKWATSWEKKQNERAKALGGM